MGGHRSSKARKYPAVPKSQSLANRDRGASVDAPGKHHRESPNGPGSSDEHKHSRRILVWSGGIFTAFITAVVVSLGTNLLPGIKSILPHSSPPAIDVNVEPDPTLLPAESWLFSPSFPVSRLKSDYEGIGSWAPDLGARPAGSMALKVSITARISSGITITGIEARVIKRSPLGSYRLADNPGQGGGVDDSTVIGLNLDETDPHASLFKDGHIEPIARQALGGAYFSKYSFDLPSEATHVFEVVAYATTADDQWNLRVDYIAQGKAESVTLANDGSKPFRLAGYSGRTEFSAIYFPGYMANPPDYKNKWANIGRRLCPENPTYFGEC